MVPSSNSASANVRAGPVTLTAAASAARCARTSRRDDSRRPGVCLDILGQHVERHVAAEHHGVVKRLQVELSAQRRLRLVALTVDLAVADFVAARLTRPRAIAVDFARDLLRIRSVDVNEEADTLLARPALGVDTGVDDKAAGAEGDRLKVADAADMILLV